MNKTTQSDNGMANQNADLPKSQKPTTYKIEEYTESGEWKSFWKVVDMPRVAGKEFDKYIAAEAKHRLVKIVDGKKEVVMTNRRGSR